MPHSVLTVAVQFFIITNMCWKHLLQIHHFLKELECLKNQAIMCCKYFGIFFLEMLRFLWEILMIFDISGISYSEKFLWNLMEFNCKDVRFIRAFIVKIWQILWTFLELLSNSFWFKSEHSFKFLISSIRLYTDLNIVTKLQNKFHERWCEIKYFEYLKCLWMTLKTLNMESVFNNPLSMPKPNIKTPPYSSLAVSMAHCAWM